MSTSRTEELSVGSIYVTGDKGTHKVFDITTNEQEENITQLINVDFTPSTVGRMIYIKVNNGTTAKETIYAYNESGHNTGEAIAIRGRCLCTATTTRTGGEVRGAYFQSGPAAGCHCFAAHAVQSEAILKEGATCDGELAGGFFEVTTETTGTITGSADAMRLRATIRPNITLSSTHYMIHMDSHQIGASFQAIDAWIYCQTVSVNASTTVSTAIIDTTGIQGKPGYFLVCSDDDDMAKTGEACNNAAGWIKVKVGTQTYYLDCHSAHA